jgi:pectinesterase
MVGKRRHRRCTVALLLLAAVASVAGGEFITWEDLTMPALAAVPRGMPVQEGSVKSAAAGGGAAPRRGGTAALSTIVVSQDGTGHSRTVQGAVDMVPAGNTRRVKILVRPGVYR